MEIFCGYVLEPVPHVTLPGYPGLDVLKDTPMNELQRKDTLVTGCRERLITQ